MFNDLKKGDRKKSPFFYALNKHMKKILIQYPYIFLIVLVILLVFTWANACEKEQIIDETLPVCEEMQVSTAETPCKKQENINENINTVIKALEKLGESGTLPK